MRDFQELPILPPLKRGSSRKVIGKVSIDIPIISRLLTKERKG